MVKPEQIEIPSLSFAIYSLFYRLEILGIMNISNKNKNEPLVFIIQINTW